MFTFPVSGLVLPLWLPPLAALVIAFFTSMVGISGAFLLVPFQLSVLGFASPAASATNLVFNLVAIPGAMFRYWRERRLFWPLALVITLGGAPGTLGGAPGTLVGAWLRTHWLAEQASFEPFMAAVLLYLAWRMLADWRRQARGTFSPSPRGPAPASGEVCLLAWDRRKARFIQNDREYAFAVPSMLGLSFLVGAVGTAYGIGGAFMVPLCLSVVDTGRILTGCTG